MARFFESGLRVLAGRLTRGTVSIGYLKSVLRDRWPKEKLQQRGVCRLCGCTEDHACDNACVWVAPDLCSTCAEVLIAVAEWQDCAYRPSLARLDRATHPARSPRK